MSLNLFEYLKGLVGPGLTRVASASLDEHEYGAGRTLEAAFAAILFGLEAKLNDTSAMNEVAGLIGDPSNVTNVLSTPEMLLSSKAYSSSITLGDKFLDKLFGSRTTAITEAIARASGVGSQSATKLFPVAGSLVLASFSKQLGGAAPVGTTLSNMIADQRGTLAKTVPPYLRKLIAPVRDNTAEPFKAPSATAATASDDWGLATYAWLILPLAVLIGLVWYLMVPSNVVDVRVSGPDRTATTTREESGSAARKSTDDSASSTWTAPASTTSQPARKAPPLPGLTRLELQNGAEIDVVPGTGVEPKLINFLEDRWSFIDKAKWFDFDRIRFRTGSSELTLGSQVQLRNTAAILNAYPKAHIKIGGYTDNVGDAAANLKLSDDRAKSVMNELIKLGVSADRLEAEGYGDQHPVADNGTAEGRAKNRRTAVSVRAK